MKKREKTPTNEQKKPTHKKQLLFKKPPKIKFLCSLESNSDITSNSHSKPQLRVGEQMNLNIYI